MTVAVLGERFENAGFQRQVAECAKRLLDKRSKAAGCGDQANLPGDVAAPVRTDKTFGLGLKQASNFGDDARGELA